MTIVEAVSFHHDPSRTPAQVFCPLTAVHAANCLVAPEEGRLEGIISQPLDLGLSGIVESHGQNSALGAG